MSQVVSDSSEERVLLKGIETKYNPVCGDTDDGDTATGGTVARHSLPRHAGEYGLVPSGQLHI